MSLVTVTIGASTFVRRAPRIAFDKRLHRLPSFSGDDPSRLRGARAPAAEPVGEGGRGGGVRGACGPSSPARSPAKAVLATADEGVAARLVGVDTGAMTTPTFAVSAAIGALAGVLATPIMQTGCDLGVALAREGFAAAMLAGMGAPLRALVGGGAQDGADGRLRLLDLRGRRRRRHPRGAVPRAAGPLGGPFDGPGPRRGPRPRPASSSSSPS